MTPADGRGNACQWIRCGSAVCPSRVEVTVKRALDTAGEAGCPPALADEQPAASIAKASSQSPDAATLLVPSRCIGVSLRSLQCHGGTPTIRGESGVST